MQKNIRIIFLLVIASAVLAGLTTSSCNNVRYSLRDVSIPDSIKTFRVNYIENKATYINPQISPQLTDKLRQKIVSQTRLKQSGGDADWEINATITEYSFSTSGISNQQSTTNRINVTVQVELNDLKRNVVTPYSVSRNFDFPSTQSLQQAEVERLNEMIQGLSDDIFNRLFSNW
jgi:hypothetical protein